MERLAGEPELAAGLSVGQDLLQRADALYAGGDPQGATGMAETALAYLEKLSASVEQVRRRNLQVAIEALRQHVEGLGLPPDDPAPLRLNELVGRAEAHLAAGRYEECWQAIREAQAESARLDEDVRLRLHASRRQAAVEMVRSVLNAMGYQTGALEERKDGSVRLSGRRQDGAIFLVDISADGLLRFKAEEYGGLECQAEAAEFFRRLREAGMVVNVQSEFSLRTAADRLREALLRQGYPMVQERVDPAGEYIELTAFRRDAAGEVERVTHRLDADGQLPAPPTGEGAERDEEAAQPDRQAFDDYMRIYQELAWRTRGRELA